MKIAWIILAFSSYALSENFENQTQLNNADKELQLKVFTDISSSKVELLPQSYFNLAATYKTSQESSEELRCKIPDNENNLLHPASPSLSHQIGKQTADNNLLKFVHILETHAGLNTGYYIPILRIQR